MFKENAIKESLTRTWDYLSQGWRHLINNSSSALTQFFSNDEKDPQSNSLSNPRWGLLSANVYDDDTTITVNIEAPGLEKDEINISIEARVLTISGTKRFEKQSTKGQYQILECAYGRFTRSIPLEYDVDANTANASYKKGVLTIKLNKKDTHKRKRITIH